MWPRNDLRYRIYKNLKYIVTSVQKKYFERRRRENYTIMFLGRYAFRIIDGYRKENKPMSNSKISKNENRIYT